jgi:hypothetical protein
MSTEAELDNFTVTVIQQYAPFLRWLHAHRIILFASPGFERTPMPRIRHGREDRNELCFRLYVPRKLGDGELHPNSTAEWELMFNCFRSGMKVHNIDPKQIRIPRMIEGWPTDVVERS